MIVATVIALATLPLAVEAPPSSLPTEPVPAFLVSLLTNVSQVVLVDDPWAGALILAGLFLASLRAGAAAVLGSAIGSATAVVMGEPWGEIVTLLMHRAGVETYTWPYILTTWVALVVAHFLPGLKRA